MLTKDERTKLFEIQARGTFAAAFLIRGLSPGEYWPVIRGEEEITMRAMGEIGHVTGFTMSLQFSPCAEDGGNQSEEQ